jgi:hypothetical protein
MYLTPAASTVEMISSGSCKTKSVWADFCKCSWYTHNAGDLDGINTRNIAVESLPPGNPAGGRVCQSDEALKDLAGALLDSIIMANELEELFAVGASLATETRTGENNTADHAGAQRAVL